MAQPVVVLDSDLGFFGNGSEVTDKLLPVLPTMPVDGEDENGTESIITTDHEEFIATTYTIVLPLIASVGIVGNLLIVVVLVRHNFQGFIYTYIKSLALTDLCYLIFTMQVSCYENNSECPDWRASYITFCIRPRGSLRSTTCSSTTTATPRASR